jgi:hypothetical protein
MAMTAGIKHIAMSGLVALSLVAGSGIALTPRPMHASAPSSMADRCPPGYVLWEAGSGEAVCVPPETAQNLSWAIVQPPLQDIPGAVPPAPAPGTPEPAR